MIESQVVDGSTMVSSRNLTMLSNGGSNQVSNYENGMVDLSRVDNKDNRQCNYYKQPGHEKDHCWKLHGKSPNFGKK